MTVRKNIYIFFIYFIAEISNFSYMGFFRKCSMFCWSIPLRKKRNLMTLVQNTSNTVEKINPNYANKMVNILNKFDCRL